MDPRRSTISTLLVPTRIGGLALLISVLTLPVFAGDWPMWRGPLANGQSTETGLLESWSQDGENLLWRAPFTGRSSVVVFDGRACASGRGGAGIGKQEMVACFDADTGELLWEDRFPVYLTTVPWTRVGWASPTGDPETGYLYVQGVGGLFRVYDREGRIVWSRSLIEELGFMEGYGGRTQTPMIDEDRLVVTFTSNTWAEQKIPRHRLYAFDKRTGELLWWSQPSNQNYDKNTQSTPMAAVVDGRRILVHGSGSGFIEAVDARTGETVWVFELSKRGLNTSVTVADGVVYASHSEDNLDGPTMGRVVAIDAKGSGNITGTGELWRSSVGAGFSSLTVHGDRIYVVDNAANLHVLDRATGKEVGELGLGRVGKGSPTWADGKLYVTEVNGRFLIVDVSGDEPKLLDHEEIEMPNGQRMAEIYGTPAIAEGRIYFTTEEGIYALGPAEPATSEPPSRTDLAQAPAPAGTLVGQIVAHPADLLLLPGESATLRISTFDAKGRPVETDQNASWALVDLKGSLDGSTLTVDPGLGFQQGYVEATLGELKTRARVRVARDDSWRDDLESLAVGEPPPFLFHFVTRFSVEEVDGNKVVVKSPSPVKIHRHNSFMGPPSMSGYTVQADLMGVADGRKKPDMGLINSGYTLDIMTKQQIELKSWPAENRMAVTVPFSWETGKWYTAKFQTKPRHDGVLVRAKVWPRGEAEPEEWTVSTVDPVGIPAGSPGLYGFSPAPIYFDNIAVTVD